MAWIVNSLVILLSVSHFCTAEEYNTKRGYKDAQLAPLYARDNRDIVYWDDYCRLPGVQVDYTVFKFNRFMLNSYYLDHGDWINCTIVVKTPVPYRLLLQTVHNYNIEVCKVASPSPYGSSSPYTQIEIRWKMQSSLHGNLPEKKCEGTEPVMDNITFASPILLNIAGAYRDLQELQVVLVSVFDLKLAEESAHCPVSYQLCRELNVCAPVEVLCKGVFHCPSWASLENLCGGQLPQLPDFSHKPTENKKLNVSVPDHRNYHYSSTRVNKIGWLVVSMTVILFMCLTVVWSIHYIRKRRYSLHMRMMQQLEQLATEAHPYHLGTRPPPIYIPSPLPDYSTLPKVNELPPPYTPGTQETSGLLSHAQRQPEETPPPPPYDPNNSSTAPILADASQPHYYLQPPPGGAVLCSHLQQRQETEQQSVQQQTEERTEDV